MIIWVPFSPQGKSDLVQDYDPFLTLLGYHLGIHWKGTYFGIITKPPSRELWVIPSPHSGPPQTDQSMLIFLYSPALREFFENRFDFVLKTPFFCTRNLNKLPVFLWVLAVTFASPVETQASSNTDFFESKIRPILVGTCFRCHGDQKTGGGLRVDSREALLKGGESGPVLIPGKPEHSLLIKVIKHEENVPAMPPGKDKILRPDQIADISSWIKSGAQWPEKTARFQTARHWAFEPVNDPMPPTVKDSKWVKTSVDSFIRAKQESANLLPNKPADKITLIRRATFDLTGLPPTPAEIDAFLADSTPRAFETVVDRLLQSKAYGERWGRHWLDVVRYADTAGETADYPVPVAWRYRNYVIDAFNKDKPYDQFLREQIAGDILAKNAPKDQYAELAVATGYLAISRRFGFDSENYHHLTIQDTIDTLGQSILGLSLGCARCHDHKFDAVSMTDYYGLFGIFESTRYAFPGSEQKQKVRSMLPLLPPAESQKLWQQYNREVASLTSQLTQSNQPVPGVILRSLHDLDGDFELQAPAAGGSNGVLVHPWMYEGPISLTPGAQSPFKNLYAQGKVGVVLPGNGKPYQMNQAFLASQIQDPGQPVFVNLDFRVSGSRPLPKGLHQFSLNQLTSGPIVQLMISSDKLMLKRGETLETLGEIKPDEWHNLQLAIDPNLKTLSGTLSRTGSKSEFSGKPISAKNTTTIDSVVFSNGSPKETLSPTLEIDNFGLQLNSIAPASLEIPKTETSSDLASRNKPDPKVLNEQLLGLTKQDGDLEMQTRETPPASPFNPGPNSLVKISPASQSPYRNVFPAGELGIRLPNRAEYDGFGLTLTQVKPDKDQRLYVSFDFQTNEVKAGGQGSWRYYIGHGPGPSAAVELFLNEKDFYRRSGDLKEMVSPIRVGEWYQVQLVLDLKAKTYSGLLLAPNQKTPFSGKFATGWDGQIDYSFIDAYGHLGGVRPGLSADNFFVGDKPQLPLESKAIATTGGAGNSRRSRVLELRKQLAAIESKAEIARQKLNTLLADGPFPLSYGVVEGTPHNSHIHKRGEPDQPGALAPRGFIPSLGGSSSPLPGMEGSGRLELAQWLTRVDHPLTARVMVNRIWQYHFGRGLVKTPNDFGVRGLAPTHPELLDHLATRFIKNGWSIKAMHRLIMLSATYQQSSAPPVQTASEPARDLTDFYVTNPRRRLSAEEIRDSILAVSGELDTIQGKEHAFPSPISWGFSQHGPFIAVYDHNKRSVYLMVQRLKRHPFLALFDGADPNTTTADRLTTTVPTQALFFLNDPFVFDKCDKWAGRLLSSSKGESEQLDLVWRTALGRSPSPGEIEEAREFFKDYRTELKTMGLNQPEKRSWGAYLRILIGSNEFLHVD